MHTALRSRALEIHFSTSVLFMYTANANIFNFLYITYMMSCAFKFIGRRKTRNSSSNYQHLFWILSRFMVVPHLIDIKRCKTVKD